MKRGKNFLFVVAGCLLIGPVAEAAGRNQTIQFNVPEGVPLSLEAPEYVPRDQTDTPGLKLSQYQAGLKSGEYTEPRVQACLQRFSQEGKPPHLKTRPRYELCVYYWAKTKGGQAVAVRDCKYVTLSGELAIQPGSLVLVSARQAKVTIGPQSPGEKPAEKGKEEEKLIWLAMYIILIFVALCSVGGGACACCGK